MRRIERPKAKASDHHFLEMRVGTADARGTKAAGEVYHHADRRGVNDACDFLRT